MNALCDAITPNVSFVWTTSEPSWLASLEQDSKVTEVAF